MCRLFGFRSVIQSQVHRSLVSADNALLLQSDRHPDGWGVAYYAADAPHVIRSVDTAMNDHLFRRVSGIVSSETVVAHLRKATAGSRTTLNTHPFQHGRWVFAHNGNIRNFAEVRDELRDRVPPVLRRFILGDTDTELLFYTLLGQMAKRCELHRRGYPLEDLFGAVDDTLAELTDLVGPMHTDDAGPPDEHYLTFLLTDGSTMIGHQGGKHLHVSTHKDHCSQRDECPHLTPECERPADKGFVTHLLFSSEPLQGENVWVPMRHGELVGVDWRMQLTRRPPPGHLPVVAS